MAGCEGWVYAKGKQGSPLRGRPCGMRAVVKVPEGLDLRAGVWLCAYHAPAKLLPSTVAERKTPNVEFSGEGKRSLTDSAGTQGYASGDKNE